MTSLYLLLAKASALASPLARSLRRCYHPYSCLFALLLFPCLYFQADRPVADFMHAHINRFQWLEPYQLFGQLWRYLLCIGVIWIMALLKDCCTRSACSLRPAGAFSFTGKIGTLWIWLCLNYGMCSLLKILLGRARPILWFQDHLFGFFGPHWQEIYHSCPSGHTVAFISVALGFSLLWPTYLRSFLLIGFLCALTRVILTYHYLSDVLGTTYFTLLFFVVLFALLRRLTASSQVAL